MKSSILVIGSNFNLGFKYMGLGTYILYGVFDWNIVSKACIVEICVIIFVGLAAHFEVKKLDKNNNLF